MDFRQSGTNLVADVLAASDGKGPHTALVTAGTVSLLHPLAFSI